MIKCMKPTLPGMVERLSESRFCFHLTGSRYLGMERPGSDWDFFAQEEPDLIRLLLDWRFFPIENDYSDPLITKVYRYEGIDSHPIGVYQVDIQLVKDAGMKDKIQSLLAPAFRAVKCMVLAKHIEKRITGIFWHIAFKVWTRK